MWMGCRQRKKRSPDTMSNDPIHGKVICHHILEEFGLRTEIIRGAIQYTHEVLDRIDKTLMEAGGDRLGSLIELANLSAIVGNLFRRGVSNASNGAFKANSPHTFPDLLGVTSGTCDIEIKVALETNKPKGHLIKPGPHLTVRYVLADENGRYIRGKNVRGDIVWIWEVRVGLLEESHFSFSNTPGDSGKTAVINAEGMTSLVPVFIDLLKCPYSPTGHIIRTLATIHDSETAQLGHFRNLL